jgi:predicted transcriptional regulator
MPESIDAVSIVLRAIGEGDCKTQIMESANLGTEIVQDCLNMAEGEGLLELHGERYYLTSEGKSFLDLYEDYRSLNFEVGELRNVLVDEKNLLKAQMMRKSK